MTGALICSDCGKPLNPNPRRLGTRCKPCGARAMAQSPDRREKCRIAMKRRFDEPGYKQQHVARCTAGTRRALKDNPEFRAMRAEQGRRVGLLGLGKEKNAAGSPARVTAGRKRTETVLAWCPVEYRDEYRRLVRTKLIRAPEARRMVEDMIAADLARYAATGILPQSARLQAAAAEIEQSHNGAAEEAAGQGLK